MKLQEMLQQKMNQPDFNRSIIVLSQHLSPKQMNKRFQQNFKNFIKIPQKNTQSEYNPRKIQRYAEQFNNKLHFIKTKQKYSSDLPYRNEIYDQIAEGFRQQTIFKQKRFVFYGECDKQGNMIISTKQSDQTQLFTLEKLIDLWMKNKPQGYKLRIYVDGGYSGNLVYKYYDFYLPQHDIQYVYSSCNFNRYFEAEQYFSYSGLLIDLIFNLDRVIEPQNLQQLKQWFLFNSPIMFNSKDQNNKVSRIEWESDLNKHYGLIDGHLKGQYIVLASFSHKNYDSLYNNGKQLKKLKIHQNLRSEQMNFNDLSGINKDIANIKSQMWKNLQNLYIIKSSYSQNCLLSRNQIIQQIIKGFQKINNNGLKHFIFTGHGQKDTGNMCIATKQNPTGEIFTFQQLIQLWIKHKPPGHRLVMYFDSCFSGNLVMRYNDTLNKQWNMIDLIYASSGYNKPSIDAYNFGGLLIFFLIRKLQIFKRLKNWNKMKQSLTRYQPILFCCQKINDKPHKLIKNLLFRNFQNGPIIKGQLIIELRLRLIRKIDMLPRLIKSQYLRNVEFERLHEKYVPKKQRKNMDLKYISFLVQQAEIQQKRILQKSKQQSKVEYIFQ